MGVLDSAYKYEDQLANQWDFILQQDGFDSIRFRTIDVSFPFTEFEVERKYSGETFFRSIKEVQPITVTLRESPKFDTYLFFKKWCDLFYDRDKRVYKVFQDSMMYFKSLYDFEIAFYKSDPIAVPIPYIDINTSYPSFSFYARSCKPVSLEALSLDYDGKPLTFSLTIQPEYIQDYKF